MRRRHRDRPGDRREVRYTTRIKMLRRSVCYAPLSLLAVARARHRTPRHGNRPLQLYTTTVSLLSYTRAVHQVVIGAARASRHDRRTMTHHTGPASSFRASVLLATDVTGGRVCSQLLRQSRSQPARSGLCKRAWWTLALRCLLLPLSLQSTPQTSPAQAPTA